MRISRDSAMECLKVFRFLREPEYGRAFEICITRHSLACVNAGKVSDFLELDADAAVAYNRLIDAYSRR